MADALAARQGKANRRIYHFPVPLDLQDWDDGRKVASVGFFQLEVDEELVAFEMAGDSMERRGVECVKASLAELELAAAKDGQEGKVVLLSASDGSAQAALSAMPAPLRRMCGAAYAEIHAPTEAQLGGFLVGRRVVVR